MDSAVDLTTGIWVEVVATVGVRAVEFTGVVQAARVGMDWASTLTLYLLLASMVLLLLSLVLGPGAFLAMGLVFCGWALVLGYGWVGDGWLCCGWVCCNQVWDWGLGLGPRLPSNSKYIFIFWMREG